MLRSWLVLCLAIPIVTASVECTEQSESHDSSRVISHIPRQRVESTAIAAIGYSESRHILEIEFLNGAVYRYLDVPPAVHRDLMSAESKARFYDSNIRRRYRSIPIRPRQKQTSHE